MLLEWVEQGGNIALKIPQGVIGLDIDGVEGFANFKALENKLGALPLEYISTSHRSPAEGFTAFFVVPVGVEFKGRAARRIDILQHHHRYQVVAPSIHPDSGREYEWRTWIGGRVTPFIPDPADLPTLPQAWVDHLFKRVTPKGVDPEEVDPEEGAPLGVDPERVDPKESAHPALSYRELEEALTGVGCTLMKRILLDRSKNLKRSGGRHDEMVKGVWAIVNEAHKGHQGGGEALESYLQTWFSVFTEQESKNRGLRSEFLNAVSSAQKKMTTAQIGTCTCGAAARSRAKRNRSIVSNQKMWR